MGVAAPTVTAHGHCQPCGDPTSEPILLIILLLLIAYYNGIEPIIIPIYRL